MTIAGFWRSLALAGAALLAGCTDTPNFYTPPPGLTADQAVGVLGSRDSRSFFQSSEYRLCWAVDGRPVRNAAFNWNQPILITANESHRLSLAYGWGATSGGIDVDYTGRPGTTVVVQGESVDPNTMARMWLADAATGEIVLAKQSVPLSYASAPQPPLTAPFDTIVPLRVIRTPAMR